MSMIDQNLQMKISSLQDAILSSHPTLPILLKEIHTTLKQDPAIVTLLSDDEINVIVSGLQKQTKISIAESAAKKVSSKSLKNTTLDDL
jgi:hypothetical protein